MVEVGIGDGSGRMLMVKHVRQPLATTLVLA